MPTLACLSQTTRETQNATGCRATMGYTCQILVSQLELGFVAWFCCEYWLVRSAQIIVGRKI